MPLLGDMETTEDEVEAIYATWYDAESWREFGYFDKENADNANSRDEKRYLEQKNKAERKRLNKEEKSRMIKLIDLTYKCDPRRAKFREARKAAKEAAAKEKEDAKAAAIKEKEDAKAAIEAVHPFSPFSILRVWIEMVGVTCTASIHVAGSGKQSHTHARASMPLVVVRMLTIDSRYDAAPPHRLLQQRLIRRRTPMKTAGKLELPL